MAKAEKPIAGKSPGQQMLDSLNAPTADTVTPGPVVEQPIVETPVVEATTTSEVIPETPTPAAPDFLTTIRDLGFQDVADENDARTRLLEAYRQSQEQFNSLNKRVTEIEPLANYGREYLETLRKPNRQPEPEQAAPEPTSKWWNPPKVDPSLVQKYRTHNQETGQYEWLRETPAPVRASAEAYQAYIEQWQSDILHNPGEALAEPIRRGVEEVLAQVFGVNPKELPERLDLNGERRLQNDIMSQHGAKIYAVDPVTKQLDIKRLTPYGTSVKTYLEEAMEMQIPSPEARWKYALKQADAEHRQSPAAVTTEKREANRRDLAKRSGATGLPNRGGSQPTTTDGVGRPQNKNLSPGQRLVERLEGLST